MCVNAPNGYSTTLHCLQERNVSVSHDFINQKLCTCMFTINRKNRRKKTLSNGLLLCGSNFFLRSNESDLTFDGTAKSGFFASKHWSRSTVRIFTLKTLPWIIHVIYLRWMSHVCESRAMCSLRNHLPVRTHVRARAPSSVWLIPTDRIELLNILVKWVG